MKAPFWITFLKNIDEKTPTIVCTHCDERHVIRLPLKDEEDWSRHINGFHRLHAKCEALPNLPPLEERLDQKKKAGMERAAHIAEMLGAMNPEHRHVYHGVANAIRAAMGG